MRAFVGLGANLGDRRGAIERTVELLRGRGDLQVVAVSTLRETEPWGPVEQPPFLNGALAIETDLGPLELLRVLLEVERDLGRVRSGERWGPRTIDLDIVRMGDVRLDTPTLVLPHPGFPSRDFWQREVAELEAMLARAAA